MLCTMAASYLMHSIMGCETSPTYRWFGLEGSDIEYCYRQNGEIADYDLIGMPKDFLGVAVLQTNMYEQLVCPMGT